MLKADTHHNCKVEQADGTSVNIHANQLHNLDLDHFQGWQCHAGYDRIFIDVDQTVWSGMCMNDRLGTLTDWQLLSGPAVCRKEICGGCTDDLIITKILTDKS